MRRKKKPNLALIASVHTVGHEAVGRGSKG